MQLNRWAKCDLIPLLWALRPHAHRHPPESGAFDWMTPELQLRAGILFWSSDVKLKRSCSSLKLALEFSSFDPRLKNLESWDHKRWTSNIKFVLKRHVSSVFSETQLSNAHLKLQIPYFRFMVQLSSPDLNAWISHLKCQCSELKHPKSSGLIVRIKQINSQVSTHEFKSRD